MINNSSLASIDSGTEYIRILSVVVPKLKLRYIQMEIFLADLVVGPNNAALQDRPEAFNRIGVNRTNDMLADGVIDGLVREAVLQMGLQNADPIS
jgi:hypothetical protein